MYMGNDDIMHNKHNPLFNLKTEVSWIGHRENEIKLILVMVATAVRKMMVAKEHKSKFEQGYNLNQLLYTV